MKDTLTQSFFLNSCFHTERGNKKNPSPLVGEGWGEGKMRFLNFIAPIIILLFSSCSHSGASKAVSSIPEWVNNPPLDERYYYVVGRSGPLIPENDAWEQAKERGRAEIGRYIVSHIKSSFTSVQSTGGDYENEIIETLSDTKLNYTEVVSQWHDVEGINGSKNHFYVLIRIEKKRAEELIRQFGR